MPTPMEQSREDRAVINVKVIDNAVLVRVGVGWLSFPNWDEAEKHVRARVEKLQETRVAGKEA